MKRKFRPTKSQVVSVPKPARAAENSPPIHRWSCGRFAHKSRQGRERAPLSGRRSSVPGGTDLVLTDAVPSVETLGYFLSPYRAAEFKRDRCEGASL